MWNDNSLLNGCETAALDIAVCVEITQLWCPQTYSTEALELPDWNEYSCEFKRKALRCDQLPLFRFPVAAGITYEDPGPGPLHVLGTVNRLF